MQIPPFIALWCVAATMACSAPAPGRRATPIYNAETGKLEQLVSDTNGDGKPDTRAYMDGAAFKRVEIDRNHDGRPDRWEYYDRVPADPGDSRSRLRLVLTRAEEANGGRDAVTRKEFYERGTIARVEEDSDDDGRVDKWERYEQGALTRMDLDLTGRGKADRRLVYGTGGQVDRVETDADGDGKFEPMAAPQKGTGR